MDYKFYSWNQDQMYLMPPSIREWLPADDYLWFLMDAVSVFDLRPFRRKYRSDGRGHPAYNPEIRNKKNRGKNLAVGSQKKILQKKPQKPIQRIRKVVF
jgi:hypothetical protein